MTAESDWHLRGAATPSMVEPLRLCYPIPIVVLAPRMTDDSKAVWRTCIELGWKPERLQGWRAPDHLATTDRPVIIYGEPLFAEAVCDQIGLVLLEPPIDWLTTVPPGLPLP